MMEVQLKFCPQGHTPNGLLFRQTCPTCGEELGEPQTEAEKALLERVRQRAAFLSSNREGREGFSDWLRQLHSC
jgi:transcription initiation factor IIE alpha subunit